MLLPVWICINDANCEYETSTLWQFLRLNMLMTKCNHSETMHSINIIKNYYK